LARAGPAGVKGVPPVAGQFGPVSELLSDPARLAATELTPRGQDTLTRVWWQQQAPKGAAAVVNEWDQLGPAAQQAMAGTQHGSMSTLVDALRPGLEPLRNITVGEAARATGPGIALTYAGHPYRGAAVGLGTEAASRYGPRMLLSPTVAPWLATLPRAADVVAPPASFLLRTGGQLGATEALP